MIRALWQFIQEHEFIGHDLSLLIIYAGNLN